jgi:hypothetical protein
MPRTIHGHINFRQEVVDDLVQTFPYSEYGYNVSIQTVAMFVLYCSFSTYINNLLRSPLPSNGNVNTAPLIQVRRRNGIARDP